MAKVDEERSPGLDSRKIVCIVLDNPDRDLLGVGLLSSMLAQKGIDVVVVPMYDQQQHILNLMPDMVLLNYARRANSAAIKRYKKFGIRVGVLDTEGGVLRCEYRELLDIVLNSGVKDCIDDYFLWGTRQYEAFQKHLDSVNTSLYLTGCPRFDLYSERWSHLIRRPASIDDDYVLIATSFSFNNPRFASREREIENMREAMGLDRPLLKEMQFHADRALNGMVSLCRQTCERYPNTTFVLRPHPFENDRMYLDGLSGVKNLHIRRDGSIISWLKYAGVLIQLNSSAAFEAQLLGKAVVSPEFFQDESLKVPVASECSVEAHSEEEYWDVLDHIIGKRFDAGVQDRVERVSVAFHKLVNDWIYKNDGRSSERVAEALHKIVNGEQGQKKKWTWSARWYCHYVWVHAYHIVKCMLTKMVADRRYWNRFSKSFKAADFGAVMSYVEDEGIRMVDKPIYGGVSLWKSNAVLVKGGGGKGAAADVRCS